MDDGQGGNFKEVNTDDDPAVIDNPNLNYFTITNFTSNPSPEGKTFWIYLEATNSEGTSTSGIVSILLAQLPSKPNNPVSLVAWDKDELTVRFDALTLNSENGGSLILSYQLDIDDGLNGEFIPVIGFNSNSLKL